jgi:DNA-binding NarL/FixJ family response regulator
MAKPHILLLDDDALHRNYIRDLILARFEPEAHIEEADNAAAAERILQVSTPDLCIFDLQLPGKSGLDVAKAAWQRNPRMRILFWSQHADELYVRKLFSIVPEDAVYGFLTKTALEDHILNAIYSIHDFDQCWIDPVIRKVRQTTFDRTIGLSDVEYETLVDLALGLTDKAIAERRFITKRGVQNRLSSLYTKLGVGDDSLPSGAVFSPRSRAITLALLRGLVNEAALAQENEYLQAWLDSKR